MGNTIRVLWTFFNSAFELADTVQGKFMELCSATVSAK